MIEQHKAYFDGCWMDGWINYAFLFFYYAFSPNFTEMTVYLHYPELSDMALNAFSVFDFET